MNFKEWLTLNEAIILPDEIVQDVYNYVVKMRKAYLNGDEDVLNKYTHHIFDFENTPYAFLNELEPVEREVVIIFNNTNPDYAAYYKEIDEDYEVPLLQFDIESPTSDLYSVVQHEITHAIQGFIRAYNLQNFWLKNTVNNKDKKELEKYRKLRNKKTQLGFMPPWPLVKKLKKEKNMDDQGALISKPDYEQVPHHMRPIEYYTNLQTLLHSIISKYFSAYKILGYNEKSLMNDTEKKKKFLLANLNNFGRLKNVKAYSPELYRLYLARIYKDFVSKNFTDADINLIKSVQHNEDEIEDAAKSRDDHD
jgi:hypothetical protein